MLELPYGNGSFAMDVSLPGFGITASIDSIAGLLTSNQWSGLIAGLADNDLAVALPKFTLKYERTLNDDLTALGMGVAFLLISLTFPGMGPSGLMLEFVKQKAYVDVNEDGTEAGASMVTGMADTAAAEFRVDGPFVFVIRERLSGTILFMGRVDQLP